MNNERLMTVLLGPHVSEKASSVADKHNQVVFRVRNDANKTEIRKAVEMMFDVKVEAVRVTNTKGKSKRIGQSARRGRRSDIRKAYVRLAEGEDIDFLGGE